jgi:hypothetical protein
MKQYLRAAISRLRPKAVGTKRFLAVLIVALCLLPTTARAAGLTDIITLLTTITTTIQNAIGGVLTGIQTLNSTINNFRQQVIWPVNALNQTRAFVNSTHAQYQTLMSQVHAIKNNSAALTNLRSWNRCSAARRPAVSANFSRCTRPCTHRFP